MTILTAQQYESYGRIYSVSKACSGTVLNESVLVSARGEMQ